MVGEVESPLKAPRDWVAKLLCIATGSVITLENALLSLRIYGSSKNNNILGSRKQEAFTPGFTGSFCFLRTVEDANGMLIGQKTIIWFPVHDCQVRQVHFKSSVSVKA